MRFLVSSSLLVAGFLSAGAGFFSNPGTVANLTQAPAANWERNEIGAVWADDFNRDALGSNWVIQGSANVSVVSNELVFNQIDAVPNRQIYYQPWLISSDAWTLRWTQRFGTLNSGSAGVGFGLKNFQAEGGNDRGYNGLLSGAGANFGRMLIQRWNGASHTLLASGAALALQAGDRVDCSFSRSGWTITATASNRANAQVSRATINFSGSIIAPTISRACFYPLGGAIYADDVSFTIDHRAPARLIVIGASSSEGYAASAFAKRYVSVIQSNFVEAVCNDSSSYNTTSNAVSVVPEILAHQPGTAVLMIGGNDLSFGYPTAQWQAQYSILTAQLTARGTKVKHCLPPPRNSVDLTALKNWISSNYPAADIIDTWSPLLLPPHFLNAAYDSGDGVHPNDAGHLLLGLVIRTNLP